MSRILFRRTLVVLTSLLVALPASFQPSTVTASGSGAGLFGLGSPGGVLSVDPSSGTTGLLANVFTPTTAGLPTTLAADPATHRLFIGRSLFIDQTVFPPITGEEILTIDAQNGGVSAESPLLLHPVGELLFDSNTGALLGMTTDSSPNQLVQIDLASGAETNLAAIPGDGYSHFAFAPALHKAYLISESFATFPPTSQLYVVDTAGLTVAAGPILSEGARGLAYDTSSNQLFAITFNLAPFSPAKFIRVDPATGNETQLGTYDFGYYLEPGIAIDSSKHTVFVTQDVFDPLTGPITHIASISDVDGTGVLGPSTNATITELIFLAPSITPDSIIADVQSALASGAITNAGVANALIAELNQARAARARGQCPTSANLYQAFVNEVNAQSGKAISADTATQLVGEAQYLIANCP